MNFTLTAEQGLLTTTLRELLAAECPPARLRAHWDDRRVAVDLWRQLAGFADLAAAACADAALAAAELGYAAAPGPLLASMCAGPLAAAAGVDPPVTAAVAGPDGAWVPTSAAERIQVLDADLCPAVIVPDADGTVRVVDPGVAVADETVDGTRRQYRLRVPETAPAAGRLDPAALAGVLRRAVVLLAAELCGTARRILDLTLAHVRTRVQFDVPIGSFQAVQHACVDMSLEVERAWSAVGWAAMTVDAADPAAPRAVHVAKAAAGQAARRAVRTGIQLHGGIGYTWEHDLHLYLRRALAAEPLGGTTGWHLDRLGELLVAGR
jgi:alkylation response protein AidB-like acyl-CoA dehydrogenase